MARTGIVSVHALQAGEFTLPERQFVAPLEDQNSRKTVPSLSFLIQHVCPQTGAKTRILYDLGIRRDLSLYGEGLRQHLATREPLSTESNVVESLRQGGLEPTDIDYVILSHVHWDHIGLPSDFPDSLFVVGNGSLELLDGTVTAKKGGHNHFDRDLFTQARVVELPTTNSDTENDTKAQKASIEDSSNGGLQLSGWRPFLNLPHTIDLFADGSLLIVDAPGHLPGHINLLCRVSDEPRYIYLAGDACHDRRLFTGEKHIAEWTDPQHSGTVCCIHADRTLAEKTLQRIKELTENIEAEVVLAHDDAWARDAHQRGRFFPRFL